MLQQQAHRGKRVPWAVVSLQAAEAVAVLEHRAHGAPVHVAGHTACHAAAGAKPWERTASSIEAQACAHQQGCGWGLASRLSGSSSQPGWGRTSSQKGCPCNRAPGSQGRSARGTPCVASPCGTQPCTCSHGNWAGVGPAPSGTELPEVPRSCAGGPAAAVGPWRQCQGPPAWQLCLASANREQHWLAQPLTISSIHPARSSCRAWHPSSVCKLSCRLTAPPCRAGSGCRR